VSVARPPRFAAVLQFDSDVFDAMVAHALDGLPDEACGLLVGRPGAVDRFVACANVAASAKLYEIDPRDLLRTDRVAEADGLGIIGVMHSHTHTEPYPSPTDVAQAPDPTWHYVIVSLKRDAPEARTYRIVDGAISEEAIIVAPRYHC
jgi:[CysO sulfur-carrier protein]-S-L-cysteine hydrolase